MEITDREKISVDGYPSNAFQKQSGLQPLKKIGYILCRFEFPLGELRVLVEVDSLEALPPVAEAWFEAEPDSPDPYREVARLYQRALGPEAALEVLERGEDAVASGGVLALAIGDVREEMGDDPGAAEAWARHSGADLDEMIGEGLVTMEKVEVIVYRHQAES